MNPAGSYLVNQWWYSLVEQQINMWQHSIHLGPTTVNHNYNDSVCVVFLVVDNVKQQRLKRDTILTSCSYSRNTLKLWSFLNTVCWANLVRNTSCIATVFLKVAKYSLQIGYINHYCSLLLTYLLDPNDVMWCTGFHFTNSWQKQLVFQAPLGNFSIQWVREFHIIWVLQFSSFAQTPKFFASWLLHTFSHKFPSKYHTWDMSPQHQCLSSSTF